MTIFKIMLGNQKLSKFLLFFYSYLYFYYFILSYYYFLSLSEFFIYDLEKKKKAGQCVITHGYIITIAWSSYGMLLLPSIRFISNHANFIYFI